MNLNIRFTMAAIENVLIASCDTDGNPGQITIDAKGFAGYLGGVYAPHNSTDEQIRIGETLMESNSFGIHLTNAIRRFRASNARLDLSKVAALPLELRDSAPTSGLDIANPETFKNLQTFRKVGKVPTANGWEVIANYQFRSNGGTPANVGKLESQLLECSTDGIPFPMLSAFDQFTGGTGGKRGRRVVVSKSKFSL